MQILVNFENGGTYIHQYPLDAMHWIMLNLSMACLNDILAHLGMQAEIVRLLMASKKIDKN